MTFRSRLTPTPYGTRLTDFLNAFLRTRPKLPARDLDLTIEVAELLAVAEYALQELSASGVNMDLNGRPLVSPHLDAAFRELLYLRQTRLIPERLLADRKRLVTLSRKGKILYDRELAANVNTPRDPRLD